MKKLLFIPVLLTGLLFGGTYTTNEAMDHIGERAKVCGVVSGSYYARSSRGQPTFINLDGAYPQQAFTVVIWGYNRHKFNLPVNGFIDQRLCATGMIDTYKGKPQIEIQNRQQLN